MNLNRFVFLFASAAALLCALAFWIRGGEVFVLRGMLCGLVAWVALNDDRTTTRLDDLEDAHSRRWEP